MITAREGTKFYDALRYIEPAIGRTAYGWWTHGAIPDGPPAYAKNAPPPDIQRVINGGIFCQGVANLFCRHAGHQIPSLGNPDYDGGTGAAWGGFFGAGGAWVDGWYARWGVQERFNLAEAKEIAASTRSGVLIGRRYRNANHDQGHTAILLPSGYVLQSIPGGPSRSAGLNWWWPIEDSHDGWYYEYMVRASNWINFTS